MAEVRSFYLNDHHMQKKQFPGILSHAITIHKSQGSDYEYMQGSINKFFNSKAKTSFR